MSSTLATAPLDRLPDGPTLPPLVQMLYWVNRPLDWMDECAERYGDRYTVRIGRLQPAVFFSHPDAIQTIFKASPQKSVVGQTNGILRPLLGDDSVILLDGDRHQRERQLLMPPFHGERMRTYGTAMVDITRRVMAEVASNEPISIRPIMQDISLRVILRAVFGLDDTDTNSEEQHRIQTIKDLMRSLLDATGSPLRSMLLFFPALQKDWGAWSPWGQFVRQREQLDQLLYQEIDQRRAENTQDRDDIMTLMLAARDESGAAMSNVEVRDELVTLLLAGHETTASALTWALHWVLKLPAIREKLLTELSPFSTQNPDDLMAIARLPYLEAVCNETLRLYPIAPITFPRRLVEPLTIQGVEYPPDVFVIPCIYLAQRRAETYENPTEFRPERFLERQYSPYEFLPFGGGNRRCIGLAFALYEMKLALATLLSQYKISVVGDRQFKPHRRGVTIAPPDQLQMMIDPEK